jgi:hypothetical protein
VSGRLPGPQYLISALSLSLSLSLSLTPYLPPSLPPPRHTDCGSPSAVRRGGEEGIQPVKFHREIGAQGVQGGLPQQGCECQGPRSTAPSSFFFIPRYFLFSEFLLYYLRYFSLFCDAVLLFNSFANFTVSHAELTHFDCRVRTALYVQIHALYFLSLVCGRLDKDFIVKNLLPSLRYISDQGMYLSSHLVSCVVLP